MKRLRFGSALALSLLLVTGTDQASATVNLSAKPVAKASPAPSATSPKKIVRKPLPEALRKVEAMYAKAGTLMAKFTQIQETAASRKKTTSHGLVFIKHPDKVRWETLAPDPNLLVSDGTIVWYYTPPFDEGEAGQLIERRTKDVQSRLAHALLSAAFSKEKGLTVKALARDRFELTPRKGTAATIMKADIRIDLENSLITQVILTHRGGNRAEINLTEIILGEPIDDALFRFVPPPGTEKID